LAGPGLSGMIAVDVIAIISTWSVVRYMNVLSLKRQVLFVIYIAKRPSLSLCLIRRASESISEQVSTNDRWNRHQALDGCGP
jgi:hypothetical protein